MKTPIIPNVVPKAPNTTSKESQLQWSLKQGNSFAGFSWHFSWRSALRWHILYSQFPALCLQSAVLNWQTAQENPFSVSRSQNSPQVIGAAIFDSFVCLRARVALFYWVAAFAAHTEARTLQRPVDGVTDPPPSALINDASRSHIALSNRAPSGQEVLHNSWIGYPRVRGKDVCSKCLERNICCKSITRHAITKGAKGLVQLECGKFPYSKMLNNGAFNPKQNSQFISKVCFIVHLRFVSLQDKYDSIKIWE